MTPLRFRAWHVGNGKMFPVTGLHFFEGGELSGISIDTEDGEKQYALTYYKVMQSTGLKDRNGKEIFEGDILEDSGPLRSVVRWDASNACFGTKYDTPMIFFHREVVGNIYENPDLLPQAE